MNRPVAGTRRAAPARAGRPVPPPEAALPEHSPRRPGPWLALTVLPWVALIIPSALIFPGPLQSNGWPPRLLIFWIAGAIALGWVARARLPRRVSPAEVGLWVLALGLVGAYAASWMRVLAEGEDSGVTRAALVMFPLVVLALGVATSADLGRSDTLLWALLLAGGFSALISLAQFVSPFDFADLIRPPGMIARDIGGMGARGDFVRVKGAAAHPIELGVISGALLPLGFHFARFAATSRRRLVALVTTGVLLLSIPMSVSRSGVLVAAMAVIVYAVVMTPRERLSALVIGVMAAAVMRVAIPGLLGTVTSIFKAVGTDDSISGRTDDYAIIDALFLRSPILGHGLGTFRPEVYFFLDNQYLMSVVEGGIVLLLATIAFFLLAAGAARGAAIRASDAEGRSRAQAVVAAILPIGVAGTFFDLFSFAQVTVMLFLLVGVAGALWHHAAQHGLPVPSVAERVRTAARPWARPKRPLPDSPLQW